MHILPMLLIKPFLTSRSSMDITFSELLRISSPICLPDYVKMIPDLIIRGCPCSEHCSECLCRWSKRMILYFQDIGISEDNLSYVLGRWLFQWRMIEDSM